MKIIQKRKLFFMLTALTLSSFLLVSSHSPSKAFSGSKCSTSYKLAKAKHKLKNFAGKKAIINWNATVSASLGSNWASWKRAKAKSIPCTFSKQSNQWGCRAIAKPCVRRLGNKIGALKQKN